MAKVLILDEQLLDITISRMAWQLYEIQDNIKDCVIMGVQPKGIFLANRIHKKMQEIAGTPMPIGYLDTTFFRDDFRRGASHLKPSENKIPVAIEKKRVLLLDDVLYTGRTIAAALSALFSYGRPKSVELAVLIDRKYSRDLPVHPEFVGRSVNSIQSQRVIVEWKEQGHEKDAVWLINQ